MEDIKWEVAPQLIIITATNKIQSGNLSESSTNISTIGTNGCWCSEYYAGINEVLDMIDSVNPNSVSICSAYFAFMMNPNVLEENRYIGIVSNKLELPVKGIFSANQVRVDVHWYDDKPCKLGGK